LHVSSEKLVSSKFCLSSTQLAPLRFGKPRGRGVVFGDGGWTTEKVGHALRADPSLVSGLEKVAEESESAAAAEDAGAGGRAAHSKLTH
jgi:hypothetical protein